MFCEGGAKLFRKSGNFELAPMIDQPWQNNSLERMPVQGIFFGVVACPQRQRSVPR